jgi:cobalt-zinc-cadmium efflux system protein
MSELHTPGHAHDHSHDHHHAPAEFNRAFAVGIGLNLLFVCIEGFYGWQVNSLALLADAAHNLSDVAGLGLAWGAVVAGKMQASSRYTYGWKRASILAAFANALVLLIAMGSLGWEAAGRLRDPQATQGWTIMAVAGVGIVINTATALMFMRGRTDDLNIRGAFLHMAADALVSLGVMIAGALYLWQGWAWLDPVMSLVIALVIVLGTWGLFSQSLHLLFDGVPHGIDLGDVRLALLELPGVAGVHDLHIWAMGTSQVALTAHVVLESEVVDQGVLLHAAEHALEARFRIQHVTLQLESSGYAAHCPLQGPACG